MQRISPNTYEANWASPPSDTIFRLIRVKKISFYLFKAQMELDDDRFLEFIHDRLYPNNKMIYNLSKILGSSESFWKDRYKNYYDDLKKSNLIIKDRYYKQLSNLSRIRNTSVEDLLCSFNASSYEKIIVEYFENPKIFYSKDNRFEPSAALIADWIRQCENIAEKIVLKYSVQQFNRQKLIELLYNVIELTKINSFKRSEDKLRKLLLEAGVVIVFSPNQKGHGVSGLTKSLFRKFKLVVITDRYKNNAAFWFTLFHELSHCILHSVDRPLIHYSDRMFTLSSLPGDHSYEEDEANKYSEKIIFSELLKQSLDKGWIKSHDQIIRVGVENSVSPALILAYLHRNGLLPYSHLRKIYRKVEFQTIH